MMDISIFFNIIWGYLKSILLFFSLIFTLSILFKKISLVDSDDNIFLKSIDGLELLSFLILIKYCIDFCFFHHLRIYFEYLFLNLANFHLLKYHFLIY